MSARFLAATLLALPLLGAKEPPKPATDNGQAAWAEACKGKDGWDTPGPPFRIHGDTWYVGTCGISALLIKGGQQHVLIDTGTEEGARLVLANIRKLGVDPFDIASITHSHEHFDHVGGLGYLADLTGAEVVTSYPAEGVISTGEADPADPQFGMHEPMEPANVQLRVANGETIQTLFKGQIEHTLTAISTPGHTPGALTWTWQSCEGSDCKTIVYADSLNPISSDTYRFSDHPEYVAAFRAGLAKLRALKCDILITPHPAASDMYARAATGSMLGGMTCAQYADAKTKALDERLAKEAAFK
ncbi:subclass B3 metallo-beta-lactamase [Erythrobacter sp. NE805]|uniref:subclass B3 metallo-beta-lactamase n=1 Tax=Erythrobacter sp. NE805 TaxID=3389875 RepID=UPI00396B0F72